MPLEKFMKIAIITDDGKTICQHFGRANFYAVLTIENGQILQREMREKLSHKHFANEAHEHTNEPGQRHGFDPASQTRHGQMSDTITDCEALICGGMGTGAYESMKERSIHPIVTDIESIDEAALAYATGALVDHTEKLH
jgi:predicted Fe-Mo cluster-binding NifX family protein